MLHQILTLFVSSIELQIFDFTAEDLEDMGEIGRGNFGSKHLHKLLLKKTITLYLLSIIGVNKMLHIKTNTVMAVKVQSYCRSKLLSSYFMVVFFFNV